jgi:hypothetical protein
MGLFGLFRRKVQLSLKEEKEAPSHPPRKEEDKTRTML